MEQQEEIALPTGTEVAETTPPVLEPVEEAVARAEEGETAPPIKSVKNFWERLDEVFRQNEQMKERMNELVGQFPDEERIRTDTFRSFIYQPDRVCLTSSDDINKISLEPGNLPIDASGISVIRNGPYNAEFFSKFRIRLDKALMNVKSIQMLSCVIPNIVPTFPDYNLGFFYYRLRNLGDSQLPNWSSVTPYLQYDYVFYPRRGLGFQAKVNNTNTPPPEIASENTQWKVISNYSNTASYQALNVVYNPADFTFYQCISVAPIIGIPPPNVTYWRALGNFDNTLFYNRNDIVKAVDNFYYVCTGTNIVAQIPQTSPNFMKLTNQASSPNYYDLTPDFLNVIYLNPSNGYIYDVYGFAEQQTINRRFVDYDDLLASLIFCAGSAENCAGAAPPGSITFDTFIANDASTIIYFRMLNDQIGLERNYYYIPAGYADPNIASFMRNIPTNQSNNLAAPVFAANFIPEYTLNTKLGFTWNGLFTSPYIVNPYTNYAQSCAATTYFFMRPPWINVNYLTLPLQNVLTANTSADMVHTGCVRVYGDFVFGSSQDSEGKGGLLSVVPVNTINGGVGFYQNNFNNPLLKIPKLITEIGISLTDDQGKPYFLPNSATVQIELAVEYF